MKKFVSKLSVLLTLALMIACSAGCKSKVAERIYTPVLPTGVEEADIYVEPVAGITEDFIRGVDISTVLAEEASGVKYYNAQGECEDIFKILADSGVNYVRVRVWNDPYDKNGNSYGGGNCDVDNAAEIGRRAAQYGMKLLVDFHYSDFWADPSKQMCPKAWVGMTADEKADAAYDFTYDALKKIMDAGADIGMVQLGNETNKGMSGETKWSEISKIVAKGHAAVDKIEKKYGTEILVALHFTNPEDNAGIKTLLRKLTNSNVDYDVFAISYYPYWHGTLQNLTNVLSDVAKTYGKKVMVAETSYMYTLDDGDGNGNSVGEKDVNKNYAPTVQSQANAFRDVCQAVADVGEAGLGVFYWEPAWVPVNVYDYTAPDAASVLAANKKAWEEFGSGWASSYATEYDPNDAGVYYGGSAWDNQAMFDFNGKALPSLSVFKYLQYGATCGTSIDFVSDFVKNINPGAELKMPETVDVHYNNRSLNGPAKVTWDKADLAKVDTNKVGEYPVKGYFEDGTSVTCTVQVAKVNWVKNASFEESNYSMWKFIFTGDSVLDFQNKETDAYTGEMSMHYWRNSDVSFKAEQTITGLEDGKYYLSCYVQGGDSGANPNMYMYAVSGDKEYKAPFTVSGWVEWKHPEIQSFDVVGGTVTIGVSVDAGTGAWGTFDDFYLCRLD